MDELHSEIAIIGAGMAGLACASKLVAQGHDVRVFDKGRGPGGRMAARRVEIAGETVRFDHGAQYFTARDPAFRSVVAGWEAQEAAARWHAAEKSQEDAAWVGVPGMNGPIKAMADGLAAVEREVLWSTRIEDLRREGERWRLGTGETVYTADTVLVAIPAEQASELLKPCAPDYAAIAAQVTSEPCWAVMVAFADRLPITRDAFRDSAAPISWAARNSSKPERAGVENWILHASPQRSRELLDLPREEVGPILLADFFAQMQVEPVIPIHTAAHRWLYAQPASLAGEPALFDAELRIGIAGDYLHSPRVEGAWLSGSALANLVLA
ncbi:MAG: FAD-dependent oxidoreductase [Pseudomonadota bacterium]